MENKKTMEYCTPTVKVMEIAVEGSYLQTGSQQNSGEDVSTQSTWTGSNGWNVQ